MKVVRASIDRGTRLARQLQTFAQTAPPRLAQREIHQLMAAWMPEFEDALGPEQRLELRLRYRGTVVIDSDQLQTALVNLLSNARDASEPNAPIVLELSRAERNGVAGCRIAVIDHGEGMTDDVARHAVAPFFTTRQPGKGMGLGLTIARMVAESHGGVLEIESAFGRGTTVSIICPTPRRGMRPRPPRIWPTASCRMPGAHPAPAARVAGVRGPGARLPGARESTCPGAAAAAGRSQGERAGRPFQAARPGAFGAGAPVRGAARRKHWKSWKRHRGLPRAGHARARAAHALRARRRRRGGDRRVLPHHPERRALRRAGGDLGASGARPLRRGSHAL